MEELETGLYVNVTFTEETNDNLRKLQNDLNLKNKTNDLHTTVVYSRKSIPWKIIPIPNNTICTIKGFDIFKSITTGIETNCLILLLKCSYLQKRHELAMNLGATYDYDKYIPHITLSYDCGIFDINKLKIPKFPIIIESEHSKKLDLNWSE